MDVETRLIRRLVLTPANVNETMVADALVCGDERAVYADKAYAKRARRAWLRSLGIKDRIMHKSWGGGPPLRASQKRHNALIAPIRAQVEGVIATLKRWMGFDCVRYVGLLKNTAHLHLVGLAYNMMRALKSPDDGRGASCSDRRAKTRNTAPKLSRLSLGQRPKYATPSRQSHEGRG